MLRRAGQAALAATAVVVMTACAGAVDPVTTTPRDRPTAAIASPTPTVSPTRAAASPTPGAFPMCAPDGSLPACLVGVPAEDPTRVLLLRTTDGEVVATIPSPDGRRILDVAFDADTGRIRFETCCEPAAGERWSVIGDGRPERTGFGQLEQLASDGRMLVSAPAGGFVEITHDRGTVMLIATPDYPVQAVLAPDGSVAAVLLSRFDDLDHLRLYGLDVADLPERPQDGQLLLSAGPGRVPGSLAIDGHERVWVEIQDGRRLRDDDPEPRTRDGLVIEPATGDVLDRIGYDGDVIDQSFDGGGQHMLIAYADGTITWRGVDGSSGELPVRGFASVDW